PAALPLFFSNQTPFKELTMSTLNKTRPPVALAAAIFSIVVGVSSAFAQSNDAASPAVAPKNTASPFASMKGHHVAIRVPDFAAAKRWYLEKLDFRVVQEWPYEDEQLAYLAPPADDGLNVELLGGGNPLPIPKPVYTDLADSLRLAGYHHLCLEVDNMDATIAELRRRGVQIVAAPFDLPVIKRRLAFIADPWGNLMELSQMMR
ncbi:VOC family protein, partial [Rhizobium leguminosarum]